MIDHHNGFVIERRDATIDIAEVRRALDAAMTRLDDDLARYVLASPVSLDPTDSALVVIEPELFEADPGLWTARRAAEEVRQQFIGVDVRPIDA